MDLPVRRRRHELHGDVPDVADVQGLGVPVDPDALRQRALRDRLRPDLGLVGVDLRPLADLLLDVQAQDLPQGLTSRERTAKRLPAPLNCSRPDAAAPSTITPIGLPSIVAVTLSPCAVKMSSCGFPS